MGTDTASALALLAAQLVSVGQDRADFIVARDTLQRIVLRGNRAPIVNPLVERLTEGEPFGV